MVVYFYGPTPLVLYLNPSWNAQYPKPYIRGGLIIWLDTANVSFNAFKICLRLILSRLSKESKLSLHSLLQNLSSAYFVATQQRKQAFSAFAAPKFVFGLFCRDSAKKASFLCIRCSKICLRLILSRLSKESKLSLHSLLQNLVFLLVCTTFAADIIVLL